MAESNDELKYIHSRIVTTVIDNSTVPEDVTASAGFVLFQPYFSEMGEDRKVLTWNTSSDFRAQNGNPDIVKYGQQMYNADNWLKGGGSVLGLRLTAADAKPSFGVLNIRTKETTIELTPAIEGSDAVGTEGEDGYVPAVPGTPAVTMKALMISPSFEYVPAYLGSATEPSPVTGNDAGRGGDIVNPTVLAMAERLQMQQVMSAMQERKSTFDGWDDHYLTLFKMRGAGEFGDKYGVFFQLDQTREEDLEESRRYFFSFYRIDQSGNVKVASSPRSVSFDSTAVDASGTLSEYIDTVVQQSDFKKEFNKIAVYTSESCYNDLKELFADYCDRVTYVSNNQELVAAKEEDPKFIDFISLISQTGDVYSRFIPMDAATKTSFATSHATYPDANYPDCDFTNYEAFLAGGDNGALDTSKYIYIGKNPSTELLNKYNANIDAVLTSLGDSASQYANNPDELELMQSFDDDGKKYYKKKSNKEKAIENVRQDLMASAYNGEIDSNILSEYKYQISAIIDANNSTDTKLAMYNLAAKRKDIIAYIDCNFCASPAAAIAYRKSAILGISDYFASIWGQSGVAYDSYSKKNIDVTYCYDLAYKLPFIRRSIGPNRLIAGTTKGIVETMSSINWIPDEPTKTDLLKATINYIEEVRLNQLCIASVRTAYPARRSYLSVIRNTHAITEAIWIGRQILTDLRFEEDANLAMANAKEFITRDLQYLVTNGPVRAFDVNCYQTPSDVYDNAAVAEITLKFKDFIHTWKFNIVVAR